MPHHEFTCQSAGLRLHARHWRAAETRAVVGLVHGQGEHSGRYEPVGTALASAGFSVLALDLPGHGRSEGPRGHSASYDQLLEALATLLEQATRLAPQSPQFLYGHSLGGNVVLNYVLRRRPTIRGAIVASPWLRLAFEPSRWKAVVARCLQPLWPSFSVRRALDPRKLSHDEAVVAAYRADPLIHDRITTQQFHDAVAAGRWALQHAAEFPVPVLLMHGDADRVTSWQATRDFAAAASGDCTLHLWSGLFHELHNEPERGEVLGVVQRWLEARLA